MSSRISENSIKFNEKFLVKLINQDNQIIERNAKQSCKVLQISSELDIHQKLTVISTLKPSEYPNLFMFIFQHENAKFLNENQGSKIEQFKDYLNKFGAARPLVILNTFEAENETKFYYKAVNSTQFVDIDQSNPEDVALYEKYKRSLRYFLRQDLESFENQILKKLSWIKNSSIVLRFLRTLNMREAYFGSIVLKITKNGSKADLLAILDASFEDEGRILNNQAENYLRWVFDDDSSSEASEDDQSKEDSGSDHSSDDDQDVPIDGTSLQAKDNDLSQSVLLTAVQHSNTAIINYLIKYCTHLIQQLPLEHKIRVSTAAFDSQQFNFLSDLLNTSDFPFPDKFTFSKSKINENLQKITDERMEFKTAIEREDFVEIDNFIDKNLSKNFIYSIDNNLALTEAFKARQFGVFYYLKSLGFQGENCQDILGELTKEEKTTAIEVATKQRKENIEKSLKNCHRSVFNLCGKSLIHNRKISKKLEAKYRENIKNWFISIYKIASEMLEVAASCENLKIIFDFESHYVENASLEDPGSLGTSYTAKKWIFIGAKFMDKAREQQIKGVLAHELCHYVMGMVYENKEFPHFEQDKKTEKIFKDIVAVLDKWSITKTMEPDDECDGIISTVYSLYLSKDFGPELIVRVVHILAHYDDEQKKSDSLKGKYQVLFDFWYNHVVPEMLNYFKKDKVAIRVNATVELLKNLSNTEIEFLTSKNMEQLMENKVTIVTTNVPRLLLINIKSHLEKTCELLMKSQNLFLKPENIQNEQVWTDLKDLYFRDVKLNVFVDCTGGNLEDLRKILIIKEFNYIFVVSNKEQSLKLKRMCRKKKISSKTVDLNYKWSDLTEKNQTKLLETKIKFQNNSNLPLKELLSKLENLNENEVLCEFSDIINDQLFNLLIDGKEVCLNLSAEDQQTQKRLEILYQKRNFLKKGVTFKNEISQEKLISISEDSKFVLISDIAGSGKSWVAKNISKIIQDRTPTRWVTYVDLKEFIEEFKKQVKIFDFPSFFVDKILKPKTEFEAETFKKLYEIGKVSITFDAFDEIAPDCAEFVAELAKSFEFNDGNQLWIVTRDYFEVNLQEKLGIENVYKLSEFTEQEGINFIVASWILTDFKDQKEINYENFKQKSPNLTKYQEKATTIVQKFTVSKNQSIGLPQLFSMIVDCFKDENYKVEELKAAEIFTQFVDKMYTRWADHKGNLRKDESIKIQHYQLGFMKFHQYCAIASLFPELINLLFPNYDRSEWSEAKIIACGIINKIGSSTYSFIHETFREFFVADIIFTSLKDPKIINHLIQVLTIKKFGVIQTFLNDFIDSSSVLEKVEFELEKSVEKFYKMENFSEYFTENQEHLAKLVIEVLKKGNYENVKNLISDNLKNVAVKTMKLEIFLTFTDFIFSFLEDQDLMDMITDQNIFQEIIGSEQDLEIFENFVSKLDNEFVQQELLRMPIGHPNGNIFYYLGISQNLSQQKVEKFFEIIQKYLNEDEIVELMEMCNCCGDTIFNILVQNSRNFKPFIDGAESFLMDRNLFSKLRFVACKTDSNGQHILHFSANKEGIEFHESLWNFIQKTFKFQEELAVFVLQKDSMQNNFLHVLIIYNKSDVIEFTLNKLKEILRQADFREILRSEGGFGRNLLQCAEANSTEVKTHQILWKELRNSCKSIEEFFEILEEVDKNGDNVLGLAATFSTAEVLKFMQTELEKVGLKEKVKNLLTNLGFAKRHLLEAAAQQNKSLEVHKILWEILKNYFDAFEILEFIKHCDSFGYNLLLNAIKGNTKEVKDLTWNEVKKVLNRIELKAEKENIEKSEKILKSVSDPEELQEDEKELLKLKWIKNKNLKVTKLFDEATKKLIEQKLKTIKLENIKILIADQNIENHRKLWKKCTETLKSREVIEKLATETNENGSNFLQLLVIYNTAEVIEFTLKKFKENLLESDYKKLLKSKGHFGRNLLQVAAANSKEVETHQIMWKKLRDSCKSTEDFLDILEEVDENGSDVFDIAASIATGEIFEFMYQELVKVASSDKIKNILKKLGIVNRNLLQSAARQNKSLELHKIVWKILKENFNSFEILEFVKHCDDYGDNLLINAKECSTKEIIKFTWTEVKEVLTKIYKDTETVENIEKCEKFITKIAESKEKQKGENEIEEEEKYEEIKLLQLDWIKNLESQPAKLFSDFTQILSENNFIIKALNNLQQFSTKKDIKFHSKFWNHLLKSSECDQCLAELVSKKDKNYNNFLHLLVIFNTAEVLEFTLKMLKKNINKHEYPEVLRSKGQLGRNLLQCAAANSKKVKTHQILWKEFSDLYGTDEEFLEILEEVDENGSNVLGLAVTFSIAEILNFMQTELEKIESKEKVKKLLTNLGFARRHFMQAAAAQNQSLELHKILWEILKNYFNSFEILEFIKHCDSFGYNLLLNAIKGNTKEVKELTWNEVKDILVSIGYENNAYLKIIDKIIKNDKEINELTNHEAKALKLEWIGSENSVKLFQSSIKCQNQSVKCLKDLKLFMANKNVENHEILWKQLEQNFNNYEELRKLFFEKDEDGDNLIHFLVTFKEFDIIEFSLKKLEENLNESDFQEVLKSKGKLGRNLLQVAAANSKEVKTHQILWRKFHNSCKSDQEFLEMLGQSDEEGSAVFNLAASFTIGEIFEFIEQELAKIASRDKIRKLFIKLGFGNRNLLQAATNQNKFLEFHKTLWKVLREYFKLPELVEFVIHNGDDENALKLAVENSNEVLELTWTEVKQILTELYTDTETVQNIEKCEEIIQKILEFGTKNCLEEEIKVLNLDWSESSNLFDDLTQNLLKSNFKIQSLDDLMPIAWNKNVWCHEVLWEHLKMEFENKEELTKLLLDKNENGYNFVYLLVIYNSAEVIEFTIQKLKDNLNNSDYLEILKSTGHFGRNLLQIAAANSNEVKTHKILWKELQLCCKSNKVFLDMLSESSFESPDVLCLAVVFGTSEIIQFMFDELEKIASREEIRNILKNLNQFKLTLLHASANQNKTLEVHKTLWKFFQKYFNSAEMLKFILHSDSYGDNLLLDGINNNTKEVVKFIWTEVKPILIDNVNGDAEKTQTIEQCDAIINKFLGSEEVNNTDEEVLNLEWIENDPDSDNFFDDDTQMILKRKLKIVSLENFIDFAWDKEVKNHEVLWEIIVKLFNTSKILKNLLIEKNTNGDNFIHLLVICNTAEVIEFTINKLKGNLNEIDYQEILKSNGEFGSNLLQIAAVTAKEVKTHQILWKEIQDSCKSNKKFIKILEEVDEKGNNVFHLAAACTTSEVFEFMISELEKLQNHNELKKLLASFGKGNKNLLHFAVINNKNLETHKTIWQVICKYFDTEEILEFIEHQNNFGDNILCCAVYWNTKEIVKFTWKKIKTFITEKEDQLQFLNRKGQNGKDLHQLALENRQNDSQVAVYVEQIMQEYKNAF